MSEPATILTSARIGWQLLAKIPWLTRGLLRGAFPISECRRRLVIDVPGNQARFEFMRVRPSAALAGLQVSLHNHLPFNVEFEAWRLIAKVDSYTVLDAVLNSLYTLPATSSVNASLPEIVLSDRQAAWVDARGDSYVRMQIELHWRCKSAFHDWQDQGTYESVVSVSSDRAQRARS